MELNDIPIKIQTHILQLEELLNRVETEKFEKSDYTEAQIIMNCGLTEAEQRIICAYFDKHHGWYLGFFLKQVADMQVPAADFSKSRPVNKPVRQLLADYRNKKSKRVSESRKELIRRYEDLDEKDQLAFRIALMQSPAKTDRMAGCKYAMERWDGAELEHAEAVWRDALEKGQYDPWYWSGRLLLRHASEDFLLANQQELINLRGGGQDVKALYYFLALRLCGHPDFLFEKSRLRIGEYYRILYHKGASVTDEVWAEDFYNAMAEIYLFSMYGEGYSPFGYPLDTSPWTRRLTKADEFVPGISWICKAKRNEFQLAHISTIRSLLLYGSLMGCESVLPALAYLHRAEDAMIRVLQSEPDLRWEPKWDWEPEKRAFMRHKVMSPVLGQLHLCCPAAYCHCFNWRMAEYDEWLRPLEEKAKRLGYYDEDPLQHESDEPEPLSVRYQAPEAKKFVLPELPGGWQKSSKEIYDRPEVTYLREMLGLDEDPEAPF